MRASDGLPVADALVILTIPSDSLAPRLSIRYEGGRIADRPNRIDAVNQHFTSTDSAGRFRMTAVPARAYRLQIAPKAGSGRELGITDTITVGGAGLSVLAALGDTRGGHSCSGGPPTRAVPPAS